MSQVPGEDGDGWVGTLWRSRDLHASKSSKHHSKQWWARTAIGGVLLPTTASHSSRLESAEALILAARQRACVCAHDRR